MIRKLLIIAVIAVAFGSASFFAFTHKSSAGEGQKFTVVEHAETDVYTDLAEEGDSEGDLSTFSNPIFDEANENEIGYNNGYCIRTVVGETRECFWTLVLDDGQITVQGPFYDDGEDSVLAITGGTGAYVNARGQMTVHWRDEDGTEFDQTYELFDVE